MQAMYALMRLFTCVGPADLLRPCLDEQTVGQPEVVLDEDASLRTVHIASLDARRVAVPVRPEQVTAQREDTGSLEWYIDWKH